MRALLINSEDRRGGAARATHRLHRALRSADVDCHMLVQVKHGDDSTVIGPNGVLRAMTMPLRTALDVLPILAYRNRKQSTTFYPGWLPDRIKPRVDAFAPDLVHLHWITGGTFNVRSMRKLGRPMVWTLHDMWAFTGGCHYDDDCGRYRKGCGFCPALGSGRESDLSAFGWRRKSRAYRDLELTIVTPSKWLGGLASNSPLLSDFPVKVIPNAIDVDIYRPIDVTAAGETTWCGFAKAIMELKEIRTPVVPISGSEYPVAAARPANSILSNSKLLGMFGFSLPDWSTGLRRCLAAQ